MILHRKSAVAGIVGQNGSFRVVVGPKRNMKFHLSQGERLFIVPGIKVREPVPHGDVLFLINLVREHVKNNDPSLSNISKF